MDSKYKAYCYTILGCNNIRPWQCAAAVATEDGGIVAYNTIYDYSSAGDHMIELSFSNDIAHGLAIIQNIFEMTDDVQAIMYLSGDGTTTTTNNVLIMHNTWIGGRGNLAYNDSGTTAYGQTNWFAKNNIMNEWNSKTDVFGTPSGNRIGNWPVVYSVGFSGNIIQSENSTFDRDFDGLYSYECESGTYDPLFTDDGSYDPPGDASGKGDYTLQSGSLAVGFAQDYLLPYDLAGNERGESGAVGAYAYNESHPGGISIPVMMQAHRRRIA